MKDKIDQVYIEIASWKKNNFLLPRGKVGKDFIDELTRLLNHFNLKTHLQKHAISLALIFITIMTQKPSRNSRAKDNSRYLEMRLDKWRDQDIDSLMKECREIQKRLERRNKNVA